MGVLAGLIWLAPTAVLAQTHSVSGFMTLSYSLSDTDTRYLRSIDNKGTFRSGSIIGFQVDSRISNALSTTIQVAAFESDRKESSTRADIKWANISYRPSSQWLLRGGKLRNNLVMDAQNLDIGATYNPARLPPEVYFSTNLLEYYGASVTRYFEVSRRTELSTEIFGGRTDTYIRTLNPVTRQSFFVNVPLNVAGANFRIDAGKYTGQFNYSSYSSADSDVDLRVNIKTIGIKGPIGPLNGRMEYFRGDYPQLSGKPSSDSGAIILEKTFSKTTPYVSLAYSDETELSAGRRKNHSTGLGVAYDLETLTKLKGEIKRVRIGQDSALFDAPPPGLEANVLTLSFSKIF
jgi:hypothetical protein